MLESLKHEDLQFQELTPEEKEKRGILARLTGPIASFTKGTRNGRKYSDKLWEKAFDSPLVKEMFKNGGLPGELQHPADRSETDPTKIAIMMPEPPKKDSKGHLVASVDILDTPCGQIAYQLGKYGFKFGISSRGEGDLIQDFSGEESVDPDTYTLNAFDLVLIPACEDARLQFNESLDTKKSNKLRTILSEALENASDVDRKIMEEALDELDIDDNWRFVETYHDEDIYYDPDTKKYIVGWSDNHTVLNSLKNAKEYIDRFEINEEVLTEEQIGREETKTNELASTILQNKPQKEPDEDKEVSVNITNNIDNQEDDNSNENESSDVTIQNTEEETEKLEESNLTPQQKMDAWHAGKRRENIKACGEGKLLRYLDICKESGYNREVGFIKNELRSRGFPIPMREEVEDIHREDDEPQRAPWDTDFHRLDKEYNHNFKQFDDMEADSGMIQDFIDDLDAYGKEYDIYEHKTDPGCTIFFQESLNEAIEWADLNGTEQSAVEAALANIKNGSTVEDAVQGAVTMYNDANSEEEYADEDFFEEEANYAKVLDYVKQSQDLNEEKYTQDELFDKFGTDDLDIINAGNEEEVELAADTDGAVVEQLQKILKRNKSLESKIKTLQEKISVSYAKEISLQEELENYKQQVSKLSKKTKEIKVLTEKLSKAEKLIEENKEKAEGNISNLNESIKSKDVDNTNLKKNISALNEKVDAKNSRIKSLNEQISKYKDELSSKDNDIEQLKEQYETGQKDLEQLRNQYSKKLEQQNQIIEKYQRVAKNSVKRYIESQAVRLGVKSDEIINRLPKNYSFKDIDIICEDLQEYKFNMSNLPFSQYGLNENLKVTAKNVDKGLIEANPDDEITDYDLKIAEAFL